MWRNRWVLLETVGLMVLLSATHLEGIRPARAEGDRTVKGTVSLPPDSGSVRDVVVYLEGKIGTARPTGAVMDQKDMTFIPHVLPVVVGSTVEFRNSEVVLHNVFSRSPIAPFDLGLLRKGDARSVTFDKPGVVEILCNVHPKMRAFVLAVENNYFATPNERGIYEITGIPAGRYKLRAWHESLPPIETWANVDQATIENIDLPFKR